MSESYFRFKGSPTILKRELEKYVNDGELRSDTGLAYALLTNDLYEMVKEHGTRNLKSYVELLDEIPLICWGSTEAVRAWCESFGLSGLLSEEDEEFTTRGSV